MRLYSEPLCRHALHAQIQTIVAEHGLAVITRAGTDPGRFVHESDVLWANTVCQVGCVIALLTSVQHNIHVITEWIMNEVSSSEIRYAVARLSVP